jgi:hypothetical protein
MNRALIGSSRGRVKYLPDMGAVLLESTGFKNQSVNEEGLGVDEIGQIIN